MIWWLLFVIGWIVCGIMAYGLRKEYTRVHLNEELKELREFEELAGFEWSRERYDNIEEAFCICGAFLGPVTLVSGLVVFIVLGLKLRLCFKMPKELCEPKHPE